jgi:L-ascorbate metabolism protein UlaG (beta-lactamase superfamily)
MRLTRLDDYQSWLLEVGGRRIAIDPWLTDAMSLPPGHWLFGRRRAAPKEGPALIANADALVITGPFSDHCDPDTLKVLPRGTPVFANALAARRLRAMGFERVTAMVDGQRQQLFDTVTLEAVAPAFPYRHNSLGFIFEGDGARVYLETHTVDLARHASRLKGLHAVVMPVQGVRLLGLPFVMSPERAVAVLEALRPRQVVPTGLDPQVAHGALSAAMLWYRGTVDDFADLLRRAQGPTRLLHPAAGEAVELG